MTFLCEGKQCETTDAFGDSNCIENSIREVLLRTVSSMSEQDELHSSGNISRASSAVDLLTLDLRRNIPDAPQVIPDTPQHHAAARALDRDDESIDENEFIEIEQVQLTDMTSNQLDEDVLTKNSANLIVGLGQNSAPASPAEGGHEREEAVPVGIVDYCLLLGTGLSVSSILY